MNFAQYLATPVMTLDQRTPARPSEREQKERATKRAARDKKLSESNDSRRIAMYKKVRAATGKVFTSTDVAIGLGYNTVAACKICRNMVARKHARKIDNIHLGTSSTKNLYEWVE